MALLAGVSVTWYTWLEQGRRINASNDVLRSIGRALRLDEAGQEHLVMLAQPVTSGPGTSLATPDEVPSSLRRLIEGFEPAPAYVLGPHWEFAAWNDAQGRLYPPLDRLDGVERNLIWVLFAHGAVRELIVDWDIHARQALAEFRAATIAVRHDPEMVELVARLERGQHRVPAVVARARRRPLRDPAAAVQPPSRRPADVRVPAAVAGRVAGPAGRRPAPRARRRLGPAPGRAPRRVLTCRRADLCDALVDDRPPSPRARTGSPTLVPERQIVTFWYKSWRNDLGRRLGIGTAWAAAGPIGVAR